MGVHTLNPMWFRVVLICRGVFRIANVLLCLHTVELKSLKDYKFYIGFTGDLKRRFREHNSGKNISRKSRIPFSLIYYEAHRSKIDAQRREQYFKTSKGKSTLRQTLKESLKNYQKANFETTLSR